MIIRNNIPVDSISWLKHYKGGVIKSFYEPENIEELRNLCKELYTTGCRFDIIGHTSNTLYTPTYNCDCLVSTRKVTKFEITNDYIYCECGVPVRKLSLTAVEEGIKGFEGLINLPGTVASAIYGHATCYNCDLSNLLLEAEILADDGEVITVKPVWFGFSVRSSVLKRGEKKAIILSLKFRRESADVSMLKSIAEKNAENRKKTQPEAKNALGSIFAEEGKPTVLHYVLLAITKVYAFFLQIKGCSHCDIEKERMALTLKLLGAKELEKYVPYWNWYQWKDESAHALFWDYVKLHKKLYTKSKFEIEIKK